MQWIGVLPFNAYALILLLVLHWTCAERAATPNYVAVGCFKDKFNARSMGLLANYRDPNHNTVDWNDLKTSVVKKCAREAKKSNSNFFGIQYYGECWGGSGEFDIYGTSKNCAWTGGAYVGKTLANYVYMLTGEECTNYKTLKNSTRSRTYKGRPFRCDTWDHKWTAGWYRFEGHAGTEMADSCVLYGRCGTSEPGWFNGKLPEVKDGKKQGTVCFNDGKHGNCCNSWVRIQVRNCSGFFVYELPNTTNGCFKAYCGNGLSTAVKNNNI